MKKKKKKKTCSTTRLSQKVYERDFYSHVFANPVRYIEDVTRWREDMNFIFNWQNNILRTSAASE